MIFELIKAAELHEFPETNFAFLCAELNLTQSKKSFLLGLLNHLMTNNYPGCVILNRHGVLVAEDFLSIVPPLAQRKAGTRLNLHLLVCDFHADELPMISAEYERLLKLVNLNNPKKKILSKGDRHSFYRCFIPNLKDWLSAEAPDARGGDRKSSESSLRSLQKHSIVLSRKEVCRIIHLFLPNLIKYPVFQRDIAEIKTSVNEVRLAVKNSGMPLVPLDISCYLASLENLSNSELQREIETLDRCKKAVVAHLNNRWKRVDFAHFKNLLRRSINRDVHRGLEELFDIANSDSSMEVYENILDLVLLILRARGWNPLFPAFTVSPILRYEKYRIRLLEIATVTLEKIEKRNLKPEPSVLGDLMMVAKNLFRFEKPRLLQLAGQIHYLSSSLINKNT